MLTLDFLFNKTQAAIFERLFDSSGREMYLREMVTETGLNPASILKELNRLTERALLVSRKSGNRIYYRANEKHPCHPEITGLVLKIGGWMNRLREVMGSEPKIHQALIFGSCARSELKNDSDIDLLIVGDISMRNLVQLLRPITAELNRELNPKLYQTSEWEALDKQTDNFVSRILSQPTIQIK